MDVAILGASANPSRYAYKAAQRLRAAGHHTVGIHPSVPEIDSMKVVSSVRELPVKQHTLTVYVGADKSTAMADEIVEYGFSRIIFNPGAENPELAARLRQTGAEVVEACTLVMLATGQF